MRMKMMLVYENEEVYFSHNISFFLTKVPQLFVQYLSQDTGHNSLKKMFSPEIKTLVFDMHSCADHINKLFDGGIEKGDANDGSQDDDDDDANESNGTVSLDGTVWTNPAKLCYTVRQAMREEAVGKEDFFPNAFDEALHFPPFCEPFSMIITAL